MDNDALLARLEPEAAPETPPVLTPQHVPDVGAAALAPSHEAPGVPPFVPSHEQLADPDPLVARLEPEDEPATAFEDMQKAEMLRWAVRNETRAPEEQAEIMRLAVALGEHPDVVADDIPWARKEVDARALTPGLVRAMHPALADFLGDPERSSLARSDVSRLSALGKLWGGELDGREVKGLPARFVEERALAQDVLEKQRMLLTGEDSRQVQADTSVLGPLGADRARMQGTLAPIKLTEAEKEDLRTEIRFKMGRLEKLRRYGDGVEELGTVGKLVAKTARIAVEMGPEMAMGAGATAAGSLLGPAGGFAAGTAFWAHETSPSMYWTLSELKDAEGKPLLSEQEAKVWAHASSIPIGAANALTLEGLGASFTKWGTSKPIIERGLTKVLPEAAKRLTTAPGYGYAVGRLVGNYGTHLAEAGLMMGLDAGLQQTTLELAKDTHGEGFDAGAAGQAFAQGVAQGMEDFALIAAWGPARRALKDHGRIRASIEGERILRDIGNETRESKLAQRSPEKFAELMEKFGPDRKVYLDRKAFDEIAVKEKTTGRKLAAEIFGDDGAAYDSAVESGADLAVPAAKWGEKVVRTGLESKLLQDARFNLEDLTPNQRVVEMKRVAKEMEERAQVRGLAFEREVDILRKQLQATARAAGHRGRVGDAWAEKLSAYAANMSLRMDVSLRDAMVRVGLPQLRLEGREVLGHLLKDLKVTPEEKAAAGLAEVAAAQTQGEADIQAVRKAAKTPEEKAAAERLAKAAYSDGLVPELGNQRAREEFLASEQAKTGVHIATDMPGLKARNDAQGQLAGDAALKAYGRQFSEASRAQRGKAQRASTGDEFYAWFPTREQAEAFVADLKARLAGEGGKLSDVDQLSAYIGVGTTPEGATKRLAEAKGAAKAKYGDSRKGGKVGHGESFVFSDDLSVRAESPAPASVPKGEVGVTTIEGAGQVTAKLPAKLSRASGPNAVRMERREFPAVAERPGETYAAYTLPGSDLVLEIFDFKDGDEKAWFGTPQLNAEDGVDAEAVYEREAGKGHATALYIAALKDAQAKGLGWAADDGPLSDATHRMYARLKKAGVPFEVGRRPRGESGKYVIDAAALKGVDLDAAWARVGGAEAKLSQKERGTIRMRLDGKGKPVSFNIEALKGDKTTLAHETSHFLGWSLHKLATEKGAPESIVRDYQALLEFGGWKDAEKRAAEMLERTELDNRVAAGETLNKAKERRRQELTAKEEKIASAWEQYLADGRAPSAALRPLFARYRKWMGDTYKGLAGPAEQYKRQFGQELAISPEVRGVFDRLLAVGDVVEQARAADAQRPVAQVLRLTPEEQEQLTKLREAKYAELGETVDAAVAADGARASSGAFASARERIRADVYADVSSEPVYMARDFLLSGELRDPDSGRIFAPDSLPPAFRSETGPLRLSREEAVKLVGEERAKLLDREGYVHKNGASPDEMATLFGFDDGKAMLDALLDAPERDRLVEQETQARFEDAFGQDLAKNQAALEALGADGLHNPADILEALTIRNALAREIGSPGSLGRDALKRNAERVIAGTRHAELSPKHHLDAERKGAARAFELMAEAARARDNGKQEQADVLYREALHEWDGVLLSKVLFREASKALDALERKRAKLDKAAMASRSAALGKADPSMALSDANDTILAAVGVKDGLRPNPAHIDSALAVLRREGGPTAGIVDGENGRLESAYWDAQLLRDLATDPQHWDLLTVEEGEHVVDAVEQMRKAASHKNKLTVGDKKVAREDVIAATRESSGHLKTAGEPWSWKALNPAEFAFHVARKAAHVFDSRLTDTEALVDRLTGNDRSHPLWEFMIGGKLRARDVELRLNDRFTHSIVEQWKAMPEERRTRASKVAKGAIEDLPLPVKAAKLFDRSASRLTHGDLWMIALNLGNPGNKQRLLDGYGWTEKQVHDTLAKHLTEADWRWVEGIWSALGELYPELERVHVADTGLRPERVVAQPFKIRTADGKDIDVAGGYFPAKYDRRVPSKRMIGERQAAETVEQLMGPNYRPARTNTSAAQKRAVKNDDLIDITHFNLVPSHVATVVHDISHRLYVKELASLVLNEDFQHLVRERLGQEYDNVFRFWAQDVASTSSVASALEPVNKMMSFAKSRVTLAAVGFNVAVPIADLTNPLLPVTAGDLSAKYLAHSTRQLATHWRANRDFALQHSGELALRARHANSLGIETQGLPLFSGKLGAYDAQVQRAAYWMMEFSDSRTATTVWLAKYNELTDGKKVDHKTAVRDADALIRRYFPSNDPTMKAAWLRDRGVLGYLTFLHGFGNKVYNMNRRSLTRIMDAMGDGELSRADKAKQVGWAMAAIVGQMALVGVVGEFLSGRGPGEDKDDDAGWLRGRVADYAGYQFPLTNAFFGGSRGALPVAGLIGKVKAHLPGQGQSEGVAESVAFWGMLGAGLGSGVNQAAKTGSYLDKGFSRDLQRGRYAHALSGAVYGERGTTTPLTAAGNALGEEE